MEEHLKLGVTEGLEKLAEKARGEKKEFQKGDGLIKKKDGVIAWALQSAATRIVLARNIEELSEQLTAVSDRLSTGKDAAEIDALRATVMLKVGDLLTSNEQINVKTSVDHYLKTGDVKGAIKSLRELEKKDKYKLSGDKKKEFDELLGSVETLDNNKNKDETMVNSLVKDVEERGDVVVETTGKELAEIKKKNEIIEVNIMRKGFEDEATSKPKTEKVEGRVIKKKEEAKELAGKLDKVIDKSDKEARLDHKFVEKMLNGGSGGFGSIDSKGNLIIEMDKFNYQDAKLAYARASVVLGKYKGELGKPGNKELREYLEKVQLELRGRLHEIEDQLKEKKTAGNLVPRDDLWESLSPEEKLKMSGNFEFMQNNPTAEDIARLAEREGMSRSRGEERIKRLFKDRPDLENKFDFTTDRGIIWKEGAEEFFELCRQEIYKIKDSVPEEQLGQLMFVDQAQTYLALMGVSAKGRPEIRQAKDAVTKMLYMEFALKSLWKAGGNHEAWQRAAGLLLRDEAGTNFFTTMKIREKIRGVTKDGKKVVLPGFNVDDMMTIGELVAPNGQSWLAYISTDNMVLNEKRLEEFAKALAHQTVEKAKLIGKGKLGEAEIAEWDRNLSLLDGGEIKLDAEQMDWMRNYLHYVHVATLNVGEKLWLMNAIKPGDKGFDYASLPGGQFAEKTGLWGLLYFAKYGVTKYGFEGVGEVFVPNHGVLSYARGETLRHFLSYDGNEAWLADGDGIIVSGGTGGAKDFFFKGMDLNEKDPVRESFMKFWEEVWLDERTGKSMKTKGMRSLFNSRNVGRKLIAEGKHKTFVDQMDFTQLESLIGYEIPGKDNDAKLLWTVENLSYEMMEMKTMPSKREGDLINKYSKYYTETDTALQTFMDAPTLANKMKLVESILRYNNVAATDISEMLDKFVADNRKIKTGLVNKEIKDKDGKTVIKKGSWWNPLDYIGPTIAAKDQKLLKTSDDGDNIKMPKVSKSVTDGWYPGRSLLWTRQQYKEGTQDPMVMRKLEIQNAISWGLVSPQEGGKMMREWQKMIYLGDKVGDSNFRLGYIPVLTPFFLIRGWWVDRMGMDWEDFKMISRKQNEETWAKFKKLLGIEI